MYVRNMGIYDIPEELVSHPSILRKEYEGRCIIDRYVQKYQELLDIAENTPKKDRIPVIAHTMQRLQVHSSSIVSSLTKGDVIRAIKETIQMYTNFQFAYIAQYDRIDMSLSAVPSFETILLPKHKYKRSCVNTTFHPHSVYLSSFTVDPDDFLLEFGKKTLVMSTLHTVTYE